MPECVRVRQSRNNQIIDEAWFTGRAVMGRERRTLEMGRAKEAPKAQKQRRGGGCDV